MNIIDIGFENLSVNDKLKNISVLAKWHCQNPHGKRLETLLDNSYIHHRFGKGRRSMFWILFTAIGPS